ncbi:MAG: DMT family transporter [Candidatus Xenobia bacterium]
MELRSFAILLVSIVLGSIGQYFFKRGMEGGAVELGASTLLLFLRPMVMAGLFCYAMATLTYLVVLSKEPLSVVYPLISISYIVVALEGKLLFKERVDWMSWGGMLVICFGVYLMGIGNQRTRQISTTAKAPSAVVTPR